MPLRIETLVLGWPSNVTTLLEPGFETITRLCPSHVISKVPKWLVGSALAVAVGSTRAPTIAASRTLIAPRDELFMSWPPLSRLVGVAYARRLGATRRGAEAARYACRINRSVAAIFTRWERASGSRCSGRP